MTQKIELLQSRKPGAPGCFLVLRKGGNFTITSPATEIPVQVTKFNEVGEITERNNNCIANQYYSANCYFTSNGNPTKISGTITIMGATDDPSFLPTDIVDNVTISLYSGAFKVGGYVFRWIVDTLSIIGIGSMFIGFKLICSDECQVQTVNVQAKIFDSEENAVAFVNSLPDTNPSRTLNLDSTMEAGIKNAMTTAAQAKGWTVNETEMSQAQQSANNITEQQADNDLQKELAAVQEELHSEKVVNGTIPGGIFGAAQQSAPDLEYIDSTEKEQPQAEQTTVATPSQEDTQQQA